MKLLNQKQNSDCISSEGEHTDKNGRSHPVTVRTNANGLHNVVVDHGGIDNIGYNLTDDGLVAFLARLFGKG